MVEESLSMMLPSAQWSKPANTSSTKGLGTRCLGWLHPTCGPLYFYFYSTGLDLPPPGIWELV